jgi:hypothetical protein
MAQPSNQQTCDLCGEEAPIQGQLTIRRLGEKGFQRELQLCSVCFGTLSRMLCDLMQELLLRETA